MSATTVRDWSDEGRLACYRTHGGHRRFRSEDVDALLGSLRRDATRTSRLDVLHETALVFAREHDADVIVPRVADLLLDVCAAASAAVVWLYERDRDKLVAVHEAGIHGFVGMSLSPGEGVAGEAFRERRCVHVDTRHELEERSAESGAVNQGVTALLAPPGAEGASALAVPVAKCGDTLGVIMLANTSQDESFFDDDITLLEIIAAQLAGVLHAERRVQRIRASTLDQLEAMAKRRGQADDEAQRGRRIAADAMLIGLRQRLPDRVLHEWGLAARLFDVARRLSAVPAGDADGHAGVATGDADTHAGVAVDPRWVSAGSALAARLFESQRDAAALAADEPAPTGRTAGTENSGRLLDNVLAVAGLYDLAAVPPHAAPPSFATACADLGAAVAANAAQQRVATLLMAALRDVALKRDALSVAAAQCALQVSPDQLSELAETSSLSGVGASDPLRALRSLLFQDPDVTEVALWIPREDSCLRMSVDRAGAVQPPRLQSTVDPEVAQLLTGAAPDCVLPRATDSAVVLSAHSPVLDGSGAVCAIISVAGELWRYRAVSPAVTGFRLLPFLDTLGTSMTVSETDRITDELTGLKTWPYFVSRLAARLDTAQAAREGIGVVLCDADGLRAINEEHGREAGDSVLRQAARELSQDAVGVETVARNGDEFAALIAAADERAVLAAAERLRRSLAHITVPGLPLPRLTFSMGAAVFPAHATEAIELLSRAAEALEAAKSGAPGAFVVAA